MKTFIFTFFLLAGYSFWETEAGVLTKAECLVNFTKTFENFTTDFTNLMCTLSKNKTDDVKADNSTENKDDPKVAAIKQFLAKYDGKLAECNLTKILWPDITNAKDTTTGAAVDVVNYALKFLEDLGFSSTVLNFTCNLKCLDEILKSLDVFLLISKCVCQKVHETVDNIPISMDKETVGKILNLMAKCFPPGTDLTGLPVIVTTVMINTIMVKETCISIQKLNCVASETNKIASSIIKGISKIS
ncbi:unnamed protein product [Staurois parvus]|uniref:Uncharacterized protein n=1 Tax=Staurois parvus TaxID=386267 RepID=A0ABN9DG65_9NEOB|nr:unnamed protein product [Staurois parvus]